jgi:hypothetical protein
MCMKVRSVLAKSLHCRLSVICSLSDASCSGLE